MIKNNLTICLYTTCKGHFGRTEIYRETVDGLLSQLSFDEWGGMYVHIKHQGEPQIDEMTRWLSGRQFQVFSSFGQFKHFDQSHQTQYLLDMQRLVNNVTTPYLLHQEDDFAICSYDRHLKYWLNEAMAMLDSDPNLVQVRIPRFTNESGRILGLMAKHGIDGRVSPLDADAKAFRMNDWSNNPFISRTRDLRAALLFLKMASNVPQHSEHGLGTVMKLLSGSPLPFACFNPERIRVGHLGTKTPAEADDLTKPLYA